MRPTVFETLAPVCPVCKTSKNVDAALRMGVVTKEDDEHVIEGILLCTDDLCQREYPVIDGIPILIGDIRSYLAGNVFQVCQNRRFSSEIESLLNDCCGPGSSFDTIRQHLSSYTWDHYGQFDPMETQDHHVPGALVNVLDRGVAMAGTFSGGPILDLGCSVGRTTFELAQRSNVPTVGIDLNFAMLRSAAEILRTGVVRYPRRRIGLVYDRREFSVRFDHQEHVDFWACDAAALPFRDHQMTAVVSLNTLDCVQSPVDCLASISKSLVSGGKAILACPYDWSHAATPMEGWLGGHSQRGPEGGAAEPVLRRLLNGNGASDGLVLMAEEEVDWQVRLHERSLMSYRTHVLAARKA